MESYRHCEQHDNHYGMQLQYTIIFLCVAMNSSTPCGPYCKGQNFILSPCKTNRHLISKSIKCTILLKIICKLEGISIAATLPEYNLPEQLAD